MYALHGVKFSDRTTARAAKLVKRIVGSYPERQTKVTVLLAHLPSKEPQSFVEAYGNRFFHYFGDEEIDLLKESLVLLSEDANPKLPKHSLEFGTPEIEKVLKRLVTTKKGDKKALNSVRFDYNNLEGRRRVTIDVTKAKAWLKNTGLFKFHSTFDGRRSVLTIVGNDIPIPPNTYQAELCKSIFENRRSKSKVFSWDELSEEWEWELPDSKRPHLRLNTAAKEINEKVFNSLSDEENFLLTPTTKTVQLNPYYI